MHVLLYFYVNYLFISIHTNIKRSLLFTLQLTMACLSLGLSVSPAVLSAAFVSQFLFCFFFRKILQSTTAISRCLH